MTFHIDPDEGTEAAAELPDEQFQVLLRIVVWELAMRTSPEDFDSHLGELARIRATIEDDIASSREARDQKRFVASVLNDIESLPSTRPVSSDLTTGLYL